MTTEQTYQELYPATQEVWEYADKRLENHILKKLRKQALLIRNYPYLLSERIKTPSGIRGAVIYIVSRRPQAKDPWGFFDSIVMTCVGDGDHPSLMAHCGSVVHELDNGDIGKFDSKQIIMLHAHAIDRYIERHKFDGTRRNAEDYLMVSLEQIGLNINDLDNELLAPFDGGTFVGNKKDGVIHLRTFVMNRQLYPNQKWETDKAREFMKKAILMGLK